MTDDWSEFQTMCERGESPHNVYRHARTKGLDSIASIRMLRSVFALDLPQTKEVILQADGVSGSLDEHQQKLLPLIERVFGRMEDKDDLE